MLFRKLIIAMCFITIWIGFFSMAGAAPLPETEMTRLDSLRLIRAMETRAKVGEEQALESNVDPKEYVVGPGDVLILNLWGQASQSIPLEVTPEGQVLVPYIGGIMVGEMMLAEAKEEILRAVGKSYGMSMRPSLYREFVSFECSWSELCKRPAPTRPLLWIASLC